MTQISDDILRIFATNAHSDKTLRYLVAAPTRATFRRGVDAAETGCLKDQLTAFQELIG